jgi:spermidine/putrescine transport system ATP-binding protein
LGQHHVAAVTLEADDGHIVLAEVTKFFGDLKVVDLDLSIHKGEFFSLLGPSGCGKTTTLRMIAGLEEPTTGRVLLEGRDVTDVPSAKRPVNMVFQAYALFPHMSVFENVAFGLRIKRVDRREIEERVADVMRTVQLEGMEKRKPIQLSGGQQQRVALARALVNRPAALLLDEPLGALDLKLRKEMQLELKHIQEQTQTTFVYVTHDQEEALTMSDRIAVMDQGYIEQVAGPRELYERPATPFVAGFIGVSNVVHLRPDRAHDGLVVMTLGEGERVVAPSDSAGDQEEILITVRPEKIKFEEVGEPASLVSATVVDVVYLGSMTQYIVELPTGERLTVHRLNDEVRRRPIQVGDRVYLHWAAEHSFVIERAEAPAGGARAGDMGESEAVGGAAASKREA